jgi:membrane protease YdiL (CAAX protease family)
MDGRPRIPVAIRAVVVGLAVAATGTLPWSALVGANLRYGATVPWASAVMAALLVLWWRYLVDGCGAPASTREARRRGSRANAVSEDVWGLAIGVGLLGLVATLLLQGVLGRLVTLPQQRDIDPTQYPALTVFAWVVMSAVVAGVVEETAFRGYMQGALERRYGLAPAIVVTGTVFGLIHFSHPEVGLVLLPFYLAVSAVYGLLAAATNSTLPGMVLHAGGNVFSALGLLLGGRSEWQLTAEAPPTIWQAGIDAAFVANLAALVVAVAAAALAYRALFRAASATSPRRN